MKGRNCFYLHRPPQPTDVTVPSQDCFGRDKTPHYRDDMTGVGLFNRVNKTLYVTGLHVNDDIEETLSTQFGEFASIDKIRVLKGKACAFIIFRYELGAQFAKEAMNGQTLDGNDTLTVKWANEDPNPNAKQLAKRSVDDAALETVKNLLGETSKKPTIKKRKSEPVSEPVEVPVSKEEPEDGAIEEDLMGSRKLIGAARLAALEKLQNAGNLRNGLTKSTNGTISTNRRDYKHDPKAHINDYLDPELSSRLADLFSKIEQSSKIPENGPGSSVHTLEPELISSPADLFSRIGQSSKAPENGPDTLEPELISSPADLFSRIGQSSKTPENGPGSLVQTLEPEPTSKPTDLFSRIGESSKTSEKGPDPSIHATSAFNSHFGGYGSSDED